MSEPTIEEIREEVNVAHETDARAIRMTNAVNMLCDVIERQQAAIEALKNALADFRQDPLGPRYGSPKPAQPAPDGFDVGCDDAFRRWTAEPGTKATWGAAWRAAAATERERIARMVEERGRQVGSVGFSGAVIAEWIRSMKP